MPIEVVGPDGAVHPMPDDWSQEQINAEMAGRYPEHKKGGVLRPIGPQPGDATAASGAVMPGMQSVPKRSADNETMQQLMLGELFPHGAKLIQNSPGQLQEAEYRKTIGKNLGNLEERQRGGTEVLDMLHQLGQTADEGHKAGALDKAIGPVNQFDTVQTVRGAIPLVKNYYEQGYNLHNQLMHDIDGLVTAFVSSASKGGIQMSDARQKAFQDTMGRMMRSTNKEEFDKIKQDAERIIRGTFGLAPGATVAPTRSSRTPPPAAAAAGAQIYHNPSTGEKIQWDGTQWRKVN